MTDQSVDVVDNGPVESHEVPEFPRFDSGELQAAADLWRSVANGLRSTMDTTHLQMTSASADWTGEAREAFVQEWNTLAGTVQELCAELNSVAVHIEALIAELEHQRHEFEKLLAEIGLTIVLGFAASFVTFGGAAAVSGVKAAFTIRRLWLIIEAVGNAVARFALRAAGGSLKAIVTRFVANVGLYGGTEVAKNLIDDPHANPFRDINPVAVTIAGAIGIFLPFNGIGNPVLRGAANNVTTEALIEAIRDRKLDPGNLAFAGGTGGAFGGIASKLARRALTPDEIIARENQPLSPDKDGNPRAGHGNDRHGYQTTEDQQIDRARTGHAPDGAGKAPSSATRFRSPEAEAEALVSARAELNADLKNGIVKPFQDAKGKDTFIRPDGRPMKHTVFVESSDPRGFGDMVASGHQLPGPSNADTYLRDLAGNRIVDVNVKPQRYAQVIYEFVPIGKGGEWRTVTYHPIDRLPMPKFGGAL